MPIYEYQCKKCGRRQEVAQKLADKPLTRCPECKGKLVRLLSAPALQFKGSGWYVTDYPRKGSGDAKGDGKSEAKGDGKSEEKSGGKDDGKSSDTKDAATKEKGSKEAPTPKPSNG